MPEWDAIFSPSVPLLDLFLRGTLIFLALTALMRIVGSANPEGWGSPT